MEVNDEVLDEFDSAEAEEKKTEVKMSVITATPKDMARVVAVGVNQILLNIYKQLLGWLLLEIREVKCILEEGRPYRIKFF